MSFTAPLALYILLAVYFFFSLALSFIQVITLGSLEGRRAAKAVGHGRQPSMTAIIPCRNEADAISACIDSILAQSYDDLEVVVVDGWSEDGTWEKLQAYGSRIRAVREGERPAGWTGKNWGAYTGYLQARGEYLLFTDADMVFGDGVIGRAVETLRGEGCDMLSLGPSIRMATFWERAVLPLFAQFVLLLFQPQLMNRDIAGWSMANGQFMLMPRGAYEKAGTHSAISSIIVEDIALAGAFRAAGMKVRFYWAGSSLETRMYSSLGEISRGMVRDIQGGLGKGYGFYIFDLAYLAVSFLSPLAMMAYAWQVQQALLIAVAVISLILVMLRMLTFQIGTGSPAIYVLIYPVPVAAYMCMVAAAFWRAIRGMGVEWKGREYGMPPPG